MTNERSDDLDDLKYPMAMRAGDAGLKVLGELVEPAAAQHADEVQLARRARQRKPWKEGQHVAKQQAVPHIIEAVSSRVPVDRKARVAARQEAVGNVDGREDRGGEEHKPAQRVRAGKGVG
jgi:hypothetical protein